MGRKILFLILLHLFVCHLGLFAQSIDSLQHILKKAKNQLQKALILNKIANIYREIAPTKAIIYGHQAEEIALRENLNQELGKIYENLGWVYYRSGDANIALEYSLKALNINEKYNNYEALINCLNNLGAIYVDQEKYKLGLAHLFKALQLAESHQMPKFKARTLNNLSYNYLAQKKLDSALYFANYSFKYISEIKNDELLAFTLRNLGDIYLEKKEYLKARSFYQQGLKISQNKQHNFLVTTITACIGDTYLNESPTTALDYFMEAVKLSQKFGYREELPYLYDQMRKANLALQDYNQAYQYAQLYAQIKDTLTSHERIRQMEYLDNQYVNMQRKAQIEVLAKETQLKAAQIKTQEQLIIIILVTLAFIVLGSIFLIYLNRVRKKSNLILQKQKQELEQKNLKISQQNEEIKVQAAYLEDLNSLKNKIFSIISHDLRSPLSNLRGIFNLLEDRNLNQEEFFQIANQLKHKVDVSFQTLENLLHWSLTQMEGFTFEPTRLNIREIADLKIELFTDNLKTKNITLINRIPSHIIFWGDYTQINIILRNLLSNAIKFTPKNGQIELNAKVLGAKGIVSITDSGVGMSQETIENLFKDGKHFSQLGTENEKGTGLGLLLCKEFIKINQGEIWVESILGKTTTFNFSLPIQLEGEYDN